MSTPGVPPSAGYEPELGEAARDERPRPHAPVAAGAHHLQQPIAWAETAIYVVVGALLVAAAAFILAGTISDVVDHLGSRSVVDTGFFILERLLLLFIIAELLNTLRILDVGGTILVEPFLFVGLIAVVRRVLVITAELEGAEGGRPLHDFLIEIGALGGLAFVLALSIFLLRRSTP